MPGHAASCISASGNCKWSDDRVAAKTLAPVRMSEAARPCRQAPHDDVPPQPTADLHGARKRTFDFGLKSSFMRGRAMTERALIVDAARRYQQQAPPERACDSAESVTAWGTRGRRGPNGRKG